MQYIIRLPHSQQGGEKVPFFVTGFDNLKTAIEPLSEEEEKVMVTLLIEELNSLYPVNLDTDIVCDRLRATMCLRIRPRTVRTWSLLEPAICPTLANT
jgi:hypothetical protein